jgi:transposase
MTEWPDLACLLFRVVCGDGCRGDADTKAYMARLRIQGKSNKEAMRCLKRHLSNVVYRELVADLQQVGRAA